MKATPIQSMFTLLISCLFVTASSSIEKLGTADLSMVETTPVVWKGNLLRFESVRNNYNNGIQNSSCLNTSCFQFRSVSTLAVTPHFGVNCSFGCAYVQTGSSRTTDNLDTMWVFGNCADQKQQNVSAFSSNDLITWKEYPQALKLTGFGHTAVDYKFFNTNVHDDQHPNTHVMAIELGAPSDITGNPFTSVFAKHTGDNLGTNWKFLDPHTYVWPPIQPTHSYQGACPTIRWSSSSGYYYLFNLWSENGGYGTHVQRSKDLMTWESQKNKTVLDWKKDVEQDKGQPPRVASKYYYTNFTTAQEMFIAKAEDINNSDIDFVDTVDGDVYISYSWGNQEGTEFLGSAVVRGMTSEEWCVSLFD